MNVFKEGVSLATNVVKDVVHHWNKPGGKNQVSYKEIVNLGLGGMGQQFVTALTGYLGLSVGNTLIGSTIGITPMHIQYMSMISTVLNIFFTILRGKLVDNTRTKWGRFRPYIAIMGFPLIAMAAIYIYLPVPTLPYTQKLILTFFFTIAIAMSLPLFTDTYSELQTVISSNSAERAKIIAINSIIYSFAPTLTGLFVPILADMTGGYTNINTYRYVLVPVAVLGVGMNLFTAFGCKERVVSSKNYVQKVNILEGTLEIFRNKHWWIRTVSGWIGFLEGATGVIFSWIFIYGTQNYTMYGIMNTVTGTASGLAMFATPFLLKKLGNRKLLLYHNGLNIFFVIGMLCSFKIPMLFFFFNYLNTFVNALSIVYNNVMHAEVKDYQQYISGKRMDFAFGVAGMIGLPLTLSSGLVLPYFYERMGVTTNYDILFDPTIRNNFFGMLCILAIIGAALNLIPFFFYSLSVEKHRNIVKALEYRALFDDYVNDCLDDNRVVETIEGINETYAFLNAPDPDFKALRANIRSAKGKEAKKAARRALKDAKQLMVEKDAARYLTNELDKFKKPAMLDRVHLAQKLAQIPMEQLSGLDASKLYKEEPNFSKEQRKSSAKLARQTAKMVEKIRANFPNGIVVPDESRLQKAIDMPATTKAERRSRTRAIQAAEKELDRYHTTLKVYLNAKELVREYEISKTILPDMEKRYQEIRKHCTETSEA